MVNYGIDKTMNGKLVTEELSELAAWLLKHLRINESRVYTWELSDILNLTNARIYLPYVVDLKRKDVTRFTLGSRSWIRII